MTEAVITWIELAQNGDKKARDYLVEKNVGLIWSIVRRFMNRGYEAEDLFQIGSIGLLKAIDKFDISYDVKFSTYAVPMITGEIKRFMRDDGIIKVSRTIKENAVKIKGVRDVLANAGNREPTVEELARETGLSEEDVILALDSTNEVESLQKVVYQGDGGSISLMDRLVEKKDEHEEVLNKIYLDELLRDLTEQERELLRLRYFEEKTQTEIAGRLGLSQVQISRMEKRLLSRLRMQAQKN